MNLFQFIALKKTCIIQKKLHYLITKSSLCAEKIDFWSKSRDV